MDVFALTKDYFDIDDEHGVIVKNPKTGQARMTVGDSGMRPVTIAEFINEYVSSKPHLVKASNADGGSGAGGSRKQTTERGKGTDIANLSNDDFEATLQNLIANR